MDVGKQDPYQTYDNEVFNLPKSLPIFKGGYNLLLFPIGVKNTVIDGDSEYILPDTEVENIDKLLTVGMVVKAGPLAFRASQFRDPVTGEYLPVCEPGDWAVFSRLNHHTAIVHEGTKFWVMPDTQVLYTINHPREIDQRYNFDENILEQLQQQVLQLHGKD